MKLHAIAILGACAFAACSQDENRPATTPSTPYPATVVTQLNSDAGESANSYHGTPTATTNSSYGANTATTYLSSNFSPDASPPPTATDQGTTPAETNITASIRRSIVNDASLSVAAKNVKVITVGTKVTLRGEVKSEQEKAKIFSLARQTAGVAEVDNLLETVK